MAIREQTHFEPTYVVNCGKSAIGSSHFAASVAEALKSLLGPLLAVVHHRAYPDGSLTGDVTSWTRCLSARCQSKY